MNEKYRIFLKKKYLKKIKLFKNIINIIMIKVAQLYQIKNYDKSKKRYNLESRKCNINL